MKTVVKLGIAIFCISTTQICLANLPRFLTTGFYAGAATGMMDTMDNHELNFDNSKVRATLYDYSTDNKSIAGPLAMLFLGYGKQFSNRWYTSAEIGASLTHDSNLLETSDLTINAKRNTVISAQLRLGHLVDEKWKVYGICGFARTTFDRSIHFIPGGLYNRTKHTGSLTLSDVDKSVVSYGPQVGLGFTKLFTDHISARLEYIATFYNSDELDLDDYVYTYNNPKGKYYFDTNTQELNLGVSYTF